MTHAHSRRAKYSCRALACAFVAVCVASVMSGCAPDTQYLTVSCPTCDGSGSVELGGDSIGCPTCSAEGFLEVTVDAVSETAEIGGSSWNDFAGDLEIQHYLEITCPVCETPLGVPATLQLSGEVVDAYGEVAY